MEENEMPKEEHLAVKNKYILIEKIGFAVALIIVALVMLIFINKKEGLHCDEAFSYGSSNSSYSNLFYSYWKTDPEKEFFDEYVRDANIFKMMSNINKYYFGNEDEKNRIVHEKEEAQDVKWRTREEARDYMQITGNGDAFNYDSVFWNQISDVHPPLFYLIVNTVSSIFMNNSSKYIIFAINLVFFILTALVMRQILILIDKRELTIHTILLYGLSIAGISTVILLRMYMMLSFFTVLFLYLNIRIVKNDLKITKGSFLALVLTTICGFLTQYFFCIYALIVVIIMGVILIKSKKFKELAKYVSIFAISTIIGLMIFPMSLYHMFFSERGIEHFGNSEYLYRIKTFAQLILNNFGANNIIGIALIILAVVVVVIVKKKESLPIFTLISLPIVCYVFIIAKVSPYLELRYVMNVLPIASIFVVMLVGSMFDNRMYEVLLVSIMVIGLSGYGFITEKPIGLYEGYNEYVEVAKENRDLDLVYIGEAYFNHIQSMPEFMEYKKCLLVSEGDLEWLEDDDELKSQKEFILSIDTVKLDEKQILDTVLKSTGFTKCKVLKEPIGNEMDNKIYKIYK